MYDTHANVKFKSSCTIINIVHCNICNTFAHAQLVHARNGEVLHISCNTCTHDLPDMYALRACGPRASGIYIKQIPHAHVTTTTKSPLLLLRT